MAVRRRRRASKIRIHLGKHALKALQSLPDPLSLTSGLLDFGKFQGVDFGAVDAFGAPLMKRPHAARGERAMNAGFDLEPEKPPGIVERAFDPAFPLMREIGKRLVQQALGAHGIIHGGRRFLAGDRAPARVEQ